MTVDPATVDPGTTRPVVVEAEATDRPDMDRARTVADAVLWEGYLLYPYRATAAKNRIRWQFGVLGPPRASSAITEDPAMHVECLLRACPGIRSVIRSGVQPDVRLDVRLRFLQLAHRQVETMGPDGPQPVDEVRVGSAGYQTFDEAVACELPFGPFDLDALRSGAEVGIEVPAGAAIEDVYDEGGSVVARVVRRRRRLSGSLMIRAGDISDVPEPGWLRIAVEVRNTQQDPVADRDAANAVSFLGAHLLLAADGGIFGSVLEPPSGLDDAAKFCDQRRCWPVLAGSPVGPGLSDIVLASPIILYDHPEIAPESAGALFDSTEIDEILTLRVMTMTDEEKAAARATDPAAGAIIDRCEQMSGDDLARLHGTLRDPRAPIGTGSAANGFDLAEVPVYGRPGSADSPDDGEKPWWDPGVDAAVTPTTDAVTIDGVEVSCGSMVRLRLGRRADAQDLFYADQVARVVSIYSDVDGHVHVAVVLADDPAADLHEWYGRYLYFAPDEVQPLGTTVGVRGPSATAMIANNVSGPDSAGPDSAGPDSAGPDSAGPDREESQP